MYVFFFSSRRRQTSCAFVTGFQTCALPIWPVRYADRPARSEHLLAPSVMYASIKSIITWPPSRENARRFTLLLCICSALGGLLAYLFAHTIPLSLLALNIAAMSCVWIQPRLSLKSIKFQPQELADRLLEVQENERHRPSREDRKNPRLNSSP